MYYIPLTQVCDFQGGSQPPKEQWIDHAEDGYIRMLQIRDFTQPDKDNIGYVRITKTVKTCNEDDILIGRYGASVGKILTGLSGAYNVAIIKTIPDESKLTKRFLYHYLNSPYFQSFIISVGSRAAQAGFNKEDLSDAHIPQLSLMEQEHAATQLDKIVYLIYLRKQQLSKLNELVKSRFIEMFGDPITNSKGLRTNALKDVLVLKAGDFTAASNISEEPTAEYQYPCYGGNGIRGYVADYNQEGAYSLIGRQGALSGNIQYAQGRFRNTEHALLVTPVVAMNSIWLNQLLVNLDLKRYQTGAAQPGLSVKNLQEIPIISVVLSEQNAFASFVEQTDKSKSEIQKSLEKLETLKKALMQKYFG